MADTLSPRRRVASARDAIARRMRRIARWAERTWGTAMERAPRPVSRAIQVLYGTAVDAGRDRVPRLAAEVAFFALLSLPPALLAVFGTIGYLFNALGPTVTGDVREQVVTVAETFLTTSTVNEVLRPTLEQVLAQGQAGVVGVGLLVSLWAASRATAVVMEVMKIAYDVEDLRPGWRRRLSALGYTAVLVLGLVLLLPLLVVGPRLVELLASPLGLAGVALTIWAFLYWPVLALIAIAILTTFYRFVLPKGTTWWREVPGAALALVVWVVGGFALRVYARWSIESASVFGPLSSPLVLLLWLYVTGLAVLLGVELNAELERGRAGRENA